jgi:hypothetical protein
MENFSYPSYAPWYSDCNKISSAVIMSGVNSIGDLAFWDCSNLTSISISDSVSSIGDDAFVDCSSLTNIIIPDSVSSIGSGAFNCCSSLTSIIIPDSVSSMGNGLSTFRSCSSLTSVSLPSSLYGIGPSMFANCSSLTNITIPDSVRVINEFAFSGCTSLTSVVIPDIALIGSSVFNSCDSLTDIYYKGSEDDWNEIIIYDGNELLSSVTTHYNSTGPSTDADETLSAEQVLQQYIAEHVEYYRSSYSTDIVSVENTTGLAFVLDDSSEDLSDQFYEVLSAVTKISSISNYLTLNIENYGGVDLSVDINPLTYKNEYSALIYQLMANDAIQWNPKHVFFEFPEKRDNAHKRTDWWIQ